MSKKIILITLLLFSSCSKKKESAFENPLLAYQEEISNYYHASVGKLDNIPSGNQKIYVDFSDGLVQAYGSQTNKNIIDYITQKMVGSSIEWYGLGKNHNGIGKLEYTNDRDIYNKVISPESYSDIMAPIEESLKKIVESTNDALLISDFEEYTPDGKEQKYGYAKEYFKKWIEGGNSITFFYSEFKETNKRSKLSGQKNLYFVLFNYGHVNENSLKSKFEKAIEGRELFGLKKFEINSNPYAVNNDYGGIEKSGLTLDPDIENKSALEVGDKEESVIYFYNGLINENKPFEAFEFSLSLDDLFDYYFKEKRRFSKKLFLDASNSNSYFLKTVKVKVTDVTSDYNRYIKSIEANKNKPVLEKDEGNNDVWTEVDANNPIIKECYDLNSDTLKKEYMYYPIPGEELTEIFDFDHKIFEDRLINSPNEVELVTTFHENFTGKLSNTDSVILRIDYLVDVTEENYNIQLEDFKWNSIINTTNGQNTSLYESVRNTLQDVKPKGILYSYFLNIKNSK